MLRAIVSVLMMLFSAVALAREIPQDMDVAVLKRVELPYLKLSNGGFSWLKLLTFGIADGNSATVQMSRFVRIKDENDRFITMGRLTAQAGKPVAVKRDGAGVVREIWILDAGEAEIHARK